MADARKLLDRPFGDASAALWDPLLSVRIRYRHNPTIKTLPWITTTNPEPLTHGEAAKLVRRRLCVPCDSQWLKEWEEVVPAWKHPDGPVAFPYLRVSDRRKSASGLSFEIQLDACIGLYHQLWPKGEVALGPAFSDPMTSAYKVRFLDRIGGRALHSKLQRGDHILFYLPDRSARLVADAATMLNDVWIPGGVTPHFCSLPKLPIEDASGTLVYNVMAGISQFYSQLHSERMRDVWARLRANNRSIGGRGLRGWKEQALPDGRRIYVPDEERRRRMAFIEYQRDVQHATWADIARMVGVSIDAVMKDYRAWREIVASGVQPRLPATEAAKVAALPSA